MSTRTEMTDAEIICEFMEPKPASSERGKHVPADRWWDWDLRSPEWFPVELTLDKLHDVEAKLTDEQWRHYEKLLAHGHWDNGPASLLFIVKAHVHADAATKLRCLAAVLRGRSGE